MDALSSICFSHGARDGVAVEQDAVAAHEVGVAFHGRLAVEVLGGLGDEAGDVFVGAGGAELGEPHLADTIGAGGGDDVLHVLLEVGDGAGVGVPVECDEVDLAFTVAGFEKLRQPRRSHWGAGAHAVGHGRGADLHLSGERVHVLDVVGGGGLGIDVGLGAEVGLVEAQCVL